VYPEVRAPYEIRRLTCLVSLNFDVLQKYSINSVLVYFILTPTIFFDFFLPNVAFIVSVKRVNWTYTVRVVYQSLSTVFRGTILNLFKFCLFKFLSLYTKIPEYYYKNVKYQNSFYCNVQYNVCANNIYNISALLHYT